MKQLACVLLVFGLTSPVISIAQDCAGDVPAHLEWCSRDHGFNEGASCGLNALAGTGVPLPAPVGQAILGNVWDRTNMMGATEWRGKLVRPVKRWKQRCVARFTTLAHTSVCLPIAMSLRRGLAVSEATPPPIEVVEHGQH